MTFTVETRADAVECLSLRDEDAKSLIVLAPGRGGMMTRLSLGGRHRFFLDESSLRDITKNVRGGNPVLFPSPGKLVDDKYPRGTLKQHGFARNLPWEIEMTKTDGDARATLRLRSTETTLHDWPWPFNVEYTYILKGLILRIEQHFTNSGTEPMSFGAGFHPYFHVKQSDKAATRIVTKATRAFDNVTKKELTLEGPISLTKKEVDLHLLDHGAEPCTLQTPTGKMIVRGSPEYTHFVVWTLEGKDFVCVEPWTSPGNALNTGERLLTVAPGESKTIWVEYEAAS
jgi:galactose mutarotase-like enzyme